MDSENFDLMEEPADRLLFQGQLYHKQNSKLKKLRVQLKHTSTTEGNQVFNLDIRGVKHKYHFQIDFSGHELCFLSFEEVQDSVQKTSCMSCFDRNFYTSTVYSRLLMLLYSDPDNGKEASCIKIPFLQRGNKHSSNVLKKLYDVIYKHVVSTDELKHWQVYVVRCGELREGERVFLCLTRSALVLVLNYHILHYHAFKSSQISVNCLPNKNQIEFTVHDKTWVSDTNETENFSLYKTYIFTTSHCQNIEKSFQNLMRKSVSSPYGPFAHFNIRHSEMSASAAPGTTSDNVMIIPHRSNWHDNNNSASTSGSNGHLPSGKMDNLTDIQCHVPSPHSLETELPAHRTASSNGSIPGSGHTAGLFASHFSRDFEEFDESLWMRGSEGNAAVIEVQTRKAVPPSHLALGHSTLKKELDTSTEGIQTPTQHTTPKSIGDSDPGVGHAGLHRQPYKEDFTVEDLGIDNLCYYPDHEETIPKFATIDEVDVLPPPPPCTSFSQPFAEFTYKPPGVQHRQHEPEIEDFVIPERIPMKGLLRWRSTVNLNEDILPHMYVNITQEMSSRSSIHDDFPYYRFYYNVGLVRVMFGRMSKKLKRRSRLSTEMKDLDFNKLEDHEQWYDRDFKIRSKDLKFCNLHNIPAETHKVEYDYGTTLETEDDPYWTHNNLCFTIQRILEDKDHGLFREVQSALDLTAEQLMQMQVLLSLMPSENDWRILAEYIGLNSVDITIIEHFCYTYRVLAADVVFTQWMLWDQHQSAEHSNQATAPPCHWDSLVQFLDSRDRDDITSILRSTQENEHILESTHF